MTAQTVAAPVRRQRGFNLEKWGWLFMRASGLVLVVLIFGHLFICLLYTSPSPRDVEESRMPSSA